MLLITTTAEAQRKRDAGKISKTAVNSMRVPDDRVVDTLALLDRIALRTNMVDWMLLMPNFGAEFDVKGLNWNRWTVGFNVRGNWQTSHSYKPSMVYNLWEVRLDGRQYWRTRDMSTNRNDLKPHKKRHYWDKAFSIRRKKAKHRLTTWQRGVYVAYTKYSLKLGQTGRQGTAIMAGVSYGIQRPILDFPNGNSLAFELAISAGAMYTKYNEYGYDSEDDCYPLQKVQPWKLVMHPVINDLSFSLVYRLGHTPVTHKYRYRDDVDQPYYLKKEDRRQRNVFERDSARNYNFAYKTVERQFWHLYDSLAHKNRTVNNADRELNDTNRRKAKAEARMQKALEKKNKKNKKQEEPASGEAAPQEESSPEAAPKEEEKE